jgi:hypothetical protein
MTPGWNNVKNGLCENGHERSSFVRGMANGGWISVALWLTIILALLAL